MDDSCELKNHLNTAQYVLNNTMHSSIKTSSKLLLGYELRNQSDTEIVELVNTLIDISRDLCKERDINRDLALETADKIKQYNKSVYDQRHKQSSKYKIGDYVLVRDTAKKPK